MQLKCDDCGKFYADSLVAAILTQPVKTKCYFCCQAETGIFKGAF